MVALTDRFDSAFLLAHSLHRNQPRKKTDIPYIAHLMAVTAIVLEAGGDEDLAIAALLHDAVEDQGGQLTLETIRQKFGDRVAGIVLECSDSDVQPKPPWRARKEAYIAQIANASDDAILVSLADKLHNARAILADYRAVGDKVWDRFTADRDGVLWYYRELVKAFQTRTQRPLLTELNRVAEEVGSCSGAPSSRSTNRS